jgi:hypothetical protein
MKTTLQAIYVIASLLLLLITSSCKKESALPQVGESYSIKSNVFNEGAFQPKGSVRVDSLYTDANSGKPFANVNAAIDWDKTALHYQDGVASQTVDGNIKTMANLAARGIKPPSQVHIEWPIPVKDLVIN